MGQDHANLNPLYLSNSTIATVAINDELIATIESESENQFFGLNATAKTIWELLATPMTADDLTFKLHEMYGITMEVSCLEVMRFLDEATQCGLIFQMLSSVSTNQALVAHTESLLPTPGRWAPPTIQAFDVLSANIHGRAPHCT